MNIGIEEILSIFGESPMSESAAIRYLITKGWQLLDGDWFSLRGTYDEPVCVDTAFQLQRNMERSLA